MTTFKDEGLYKFAKFQEVQVFMILLKSWPFLVLRMFVLIAQGVCAKYLVVEEVNSKYL